MQATREQRRASRTQRTCVGCGKSDLPEHLVRLVVDPQGEVGVDMAGSAFGRGAHVHPSPSCLSAATKGLSRSFHCAVHCDKAKLAGLIAEAADRRIEGLLNSAVRSGAVEIGFDAVDGALARDEIVLAVVARDAGACASSRSIQQAITQGRAVAWGTKALLGGLAHRDQVAVVGIRGSKIGATILKACRAADSARSVSEVR